VPKLKNHPTPASRLLDGFSDFRIFVKIDIGHAVL
jgi:hypothetical protein